MGQIIEEIVRQVYRFSQFVLLAPAVELRERLSIHAQRSEDAGGGVALPRFRKGPDICEGFFECFAHAPIVALKWGSARDVVN